MAQPNQSQFFQPGMTLEFMGMSVKYIKPIKIEKYTQAESMNASGYGQGLVRIHVGSRVMYECEVEGKITYLDYDEMQVTASENKLYFKEVKPEEIK